jgi:hypothetical protein
MMENVAPVRALVRRSYQLLQWAFVVLVVGIFLVVVALVLTTILLIPRTHALFPLYNLGATLLFIIGLLLGTTAVAMAIRAVTRRRENDLALETGERLAQSLDANYVFIRNINRSGLGYIDAVLIGPPGALVFRILDHEGAFANEGAGWLIRDKNGEWAPFRVNPTKQAVEDIQRLREYLAKRGLSETPVFGVIVFTKSEAQVSIAQKEPVVPVSHLDALLDDLRANYLAKRDRITAQTVAALRRWLLE